jgi:lactate racemase
MRLNLRYGTGEVSVDIPEERLLDVLGLSSQEATRDPDTIIREALHRPIGSPELRRLAEEARSVVVVVDDITRPTPVFLILPHLLDELTASGLSPEQVTILVALGTHRPMSDGELRGKVGPAIVDSYRIVQHDYRDTQSLVDLGTTPSGIPIVLNRMVCESDLVLAVGNIVPHRYCGWAGGAKMIQPGVSGAATTAGTHLMITKDPGAMLGVVENQVRHEIEAVADRTNLRFIVNTILTRSGALYDAVAGDFRLAFREGVQRARGIYEIEVSRRADVVLTSSYPADLNFWQAGKALYGADLIVRSEGIIVLASPCTDGMGEHPEFNRLLRNSYTEIEDALTQGTVRDRIGAAAALAVAKVTGRARVFLVADGVTEREAEEAGLRKFTTVQEAVDAALREAGNDARLSLLHEGAEALPMVTQRPRELDT